MQEKDLPRFALCVGESDGHQHTFIQTVHGGVKRFYEKARKIQLPIYLRYVISANTLIKTYNLFISFTKVYF